jgi:type VI secretion system protein ImpK
MNSRAQPVLSVFDLFRSFWGEVEILRRAVLAPSEAPGEAPGDARRSADAPPACTPVAVRERLLALLRGQQADISRRASAPVLEHYRQAEYVMVAAADEVFVRLPWSGAAFWQANLLELERFGTRAAGQVVFTRIESLLDVANPDHRDLAAVYLAALALGFQGRYADRDAGVISAHKQRLFELIEGRPPDLAQPLVPACYERVTATGPGTLLRHPWALWWATAAVVLLWLTVSQVIWIRMSAPLHRRIAAMTDKSRQLGSIR